MGITKSEHFTDNQNELANLLKALGHPARVAIVEYLIQHKQCICGDIVSELPLSQATISQHLRELKQVGIIQGNIEGNSICYCLNPQVFQQITQFMGIAIESVTKNKCC
jgi:DNA-binding transcriptional ArsR family regulator